MKNLLIVLIALALASCGPKVSLKPEASAKLTRSIAFLPVKAATDISRERVDYINNAVASELGNAGFIVLDRKLVAAFCPTPECPERASLLKKYGSLMFAKLDLESVARTNFIAGYYNTVSGKLTLTDSANTELVSVDNTEREKGGLLFNSGQLFQGVKTTAQNAGDSSFNNLADRFAKTLAQKIPAPHSDTAATNQSEDEVKIKDVKATPISNEQLHVCAYAAPGLMSSMLINKKRANLREVTPGEYCGNFWLASFNPDARLVVEARSPFGTSDRRDVAFANSKVCDLSGRVKLAAAVDKSTVLITCTKLAGEAGVVGACDKEVLECPADNRFIVYRGSSDEGPFERVAELKKTTWSDSKPKGKPVYQVVAKNGRGLRSLPVVATPEGEKCENS